MSTETEIIERKSSIRAEYIKHGVIYAIVAALILALILS